MHVTRIGIAIFCAVVLAGPWFTVDGYGSVRNLVSELGAQHAPWRGLMIGAFIALGAGLVIDGLRSPRAPLLPFIAFGLFMSAAGPLAHKPIDPALAYDATLHQLHGLCATLAGVAITIGLSWHALRFARGGARAVALLLAAACVLLPLAMLRWPEMQGLIQRVMYVAIFAWLWAHYPQRVGVAAR